MVTAPPPSTGSSAVPPTASSTTFSTSTTSSSSTTPNPLLGPLTTTWTAPSSCSTIWFVDEYFNYGEICHQGSLIDDINCWPSMTSSPQYSSEYYGIQGFYSPGIVCPAGHTTACAAQGIPNGLQSGVPGTQSFSFDYTPTLGETAVGCCPTGYGCGVDAYGEESCIREIASTTETGLYCPDSSVGTDISIITSQFVVPDTTVTTETWSSTTDTSTSTISLYTVFAPIFQLNYQATDLPVTSTSAPPPPPATSSSSSSSHHTTTIAVAVTVPVVVALLAAAAATWFWLRKRKQRTSYQPAQPDSPSELTAQNAPFEMGTIPDPAELPGIKPAVELPGIKPTVELPSAKPPTELPVVKVPESEHNVVHEMDGGN